VSRAGVIVTFGAAEVEHIAVSLVDDRVGVSQRGLTLGELRNEKVSSEIELNVIHVHTSTGEPATKTAAAATRARQVVEKCIMVG
jgi:hypothetical protein